METAHFLEDRLARIESLHQSRSLKRREGVDFSSNDYLGFSEDLELRKRIHESILGLPTGAAGSRLLRGNLDLHEEVEQKLARFCGSESALLFPSGYQANIGLLSALLCEGDHVFSDESNHASIIDGIRLGRAQKQVFKHNDLISLKKKLESTKDGGAKFIVTESLFSMEGDFAPLKDMTALAHDYGANLVVDESHATGVYGDFSWNLGGGLVQEQGLRHRALATIHTGGKALGVGGAWIAGPARLRDYLVNFSRPFIFSTAIAPGVTAALGVAVDHWATVGVQRAQELRTFSQAFIESFKATAAKTDTCHSHAPMSASLIMPFIVGSNRRAIDLAKTLQDAGFDVRAIRPPTVPEGTARIRLTLKWGVSKAQTQTLMDAIWKAFDKEER